MPSSVRAKSCAFRVKTGSPFLVVTRAGTRTTVEFAVMTGEGCVTGAGDCAKAIGAHSSATVMCHRIIRELQALRVTLDAAGGVSVADRPAPLDSFGTAAFTMGSIIVLWGQA